MSPQLSTAAGVIAALHTAADRIPGVSMYAREHCHGHDWLINPTTREIHINGSLDPEAYSGAALEALTALQRHLDNAAALQRIPAPRDELAERRGWWLQTS